MTTMTTPTNNPMADRAADLEAELRALGQTQYALERADLAKAFKVTVDKLDGIYRCVRGEKPKPPEPERWPDRVHGDGLLSALVHQIGRYVFAEPEEILVIALWVLHAHAHEAFDVSPILLVTSPVKGCGKSTVLDVLEIVVQNPMLSANCTPAALYRSTENHPTVLCDEGDLYLSEDKSLVAFFNAGHRRGASFHRCEGDDHHVVEFNSWCPKAIAQIGMPRWPTIVDRSIVIRLRRKFAHDQTEKFRKSRVDPDLEDLRKMAARWADDHLHDLRDARPTMPKMLGNRSEDNWEPLFAIAETIGGTWPAQLNAAVKALAHEDEDRRIELLGDLKAVFQAQENLRFISTAELVESLIAMDERPYSTLNGQHPINGNWLARQLKAFGLRSEQILLHDGSGKKARGYAREPFKDVWKRYLLPPPPLDLPESADLSEAPQDAPASDGSDGSDRGREGCVYTE
ncbi:MAG: DUF3631 domain-containing protein [Myxococcales bacterium]|nr:DUF3631 domain-containing protein [Myxococcales bacterium]